VGKSPPLQPASTVSQSTIYYSEKLKSVPLFKNQAPSSPAVAENAQQAPHYP